MTPGTPDETLSPDLAQRLTEFARACKAATRSVTLYPGGHPSTSMAPDAAGGIRAAARPSADR